MTTTGDEIALQVQEAVRSHGMGTLRAEQSRNHLIGMSELGACRNFLRHMVIETPYDENEDDIRWPAFLGTAIGDALEKAVSDQFGYLVQQTVQVTLPSGKVLSGHCDVQTDTAVWDFKAVDGLESIKRSGPTFRQKAQIMGYLLALIQSGDLPEDALAVLVYIDRSGRDPKPWVWSSMLDMSILEEADSRLDDVTYAVMHDEEASRDEPDSWCQVACPFYTKCRGGSTDVGGLIEDEHAALAVKNYVDGREMEKAGARLKDEAKRDLKNVEGSTGEHIVRWIRINETEVPGFTRKAYDRMDVRAVRRRAQ